MSFNWRIESGDIIERHFNPRHTIPNVMDVLQAIPAAAADARENLSGRYDIRYGERPKETMDLFPAISDGSPVAGHLPPAQIFIHGGYWRMMDKNDYSHLARPMVNQGVSHISLNYDLCPEVTLDVIVDEIKTAIVYIFNNAESLNIDRDRIYIAGHSAGGHLTGMMLAEDWASHGLPVDVLKGGVSISGVFEPEAILHTSINEDVRLDLEMALRNAVMTSPPPPGTPIVAAVGADELEGFHQQSIDYVDYCNDNGCEAEFYVIPGCHHFSALDAAFDPDHELHRKLMAQIKL